ncbi:MurR/RpiR family transcriptional regulator [Selenomonas bovis]|uniref:MurR/RpiR family transcriptional regulator n=1 Tax=Selenomonas bovis TaxID=416586 RepID=UPI00035FEE58|nr:MurR/RpiR family transcriptional regulator [Selenomonas bovis]
MLNDRIKEKYDTMSKTQKKIANYVLQNVTDASYLNVKKFSQFVGVSEASIIRFCEFLGYRGFIELKKELQSLSKQENSMRERVRKSYKAYGEKEAGVVDVFHDDILRIENTLTKLDMESFFQACNEIVLANHIYIIAFRSANALGRFFQYYLNMALGNVTLISNDDCDVDGITKATPQDVVIGITFNRYTSRTVKLMEYSANKGCKQIAITDSTVSPIVKFSSFHFYAETSMPTYLDSFAAPLTLINAFLTVIGRMRNVELEYRVSELDQFYKEFHVFE